MSRFRRSRRLPRQLDTKARVELACQVLQTLAWPSGSFVMAADVGLEPTSSGSEPDLLPEYPQMKMVRVAGFDPAVSCARGTRFTRLSYTLMDRMGRVERPFSA